MKTYIKLLLLYFLMFVPYSAAQTEYAERQDVIWARSVGDASITLDGVLDEPAWASAESLKITYGNMPDLPTSGWRPEFQPEAVTDPTNATVKFLSKGDNLYLAFTIPDSSIVGSVDWARWDAILMSVKDKAGANRPADAVEFFYTYWYSGLPDSLGPKPGDKPRFVGRFGNFNDTSRTEEQRAAWDAFTLIDGTANDGERDRGWTVEMRIDVSKLGYKISDAEGDVVALNFSIWDCDYLYEGNVNAISTTRTHWQSPWGNANANNVGRIHVRPDINLTSQLPKVNPDVIIPTVAEFEAPVIDGELTETAWESAYTFDMAWGDSLLRETYPGLGKLSSGQFQPELTVGQRPPILDPSKATVKMWFHADTLYLGADISDQLIQGSGVFDQIDGIRFIIGDRGAVNVESVMEFRQLTVNFGASGNPEPLDYLPVLLDTGGTAYAVKVKGAGTVNNHTDIDEGYSVEMKVDLTKLGYPAGLGDKLIFMGVMLADGDSFDNPANNYGSRVWWFREHNGGPAAAWIEMDPNVTDVEVTGNTGIPLKFELSGNYPNPFNPSTKINYSIPEQGDVELAVFNLLGQKLQVLNMVSQTAGRHTITFDGNNLSSGIYFYQINYRNGRTGSEEFRSGKMLLLK